MAKENWWIGKIKRIYGMTHRVRKKKKKFVSAKNRNVYRREWTGQRSKGRKEGSVVCELLVRMHASYSSWNGFVHIHRNSSQETCSVCVAKMAFGDDFNVEGDQNSDRKTHTLANLHTRKTGAVNRTQWKHAQAQMSVYFVTRAKQAFYPYNQLHNWFIR